LEHIKIGTEKASIAAAAAILSVCLLLFLTIGSFIINTKMRQASAQLPDHLYTPHTGIIHQTPERVTLVPLQPQR
jgi:hypothetical protein